MSAVAILFLQSLFHQPVGWATFAIPVALMVTTAVDSFAGLILLAAFGPLATVLFVLTSVAPVSVQYSEALALAFIAGWAVRRTLAPSALAVPAGTRWAALLLLFAAAASGITNWAILRAEHLGTPAQVLLQDFITRDYLRHLAGSAPIAQASLVCECVLLLLLVADTCAQREERRDTVLRAMVGGAAAAGVLNMVRVVSASMAQEHAWTALLHYLRTLRVNVQYGDLNAAGSYFALMLLISLGFLVRRRTFAAVCLLPIGGALWIAGSRFALGGALGGLAIGALLGFRGRSRRGPAVLGFALVGVVAATLWTFYPEKRNAAVDVALGIRLELAKAGLDMAAHNPVFGVGLGRFYAESEPYLRATQIAGVRENAHNYFVQIVAELGVTGLLLFLATVTASIYTLLRSATPLPGPSIGLLAGLIAFLLSCLGGHPLIVPESSYPFWTAMGLAATPHSAVAGRGRVAGVAVRIAGSAAILLFALSLPYRMIEGSRGADMSAVSIGLSRWQRDPDGTPYRWAGGRSSFFVESSAKVVRLPLRNRHPGRTDLEVGVFLNGREADRILLPLDGEWQVHRLILPRMAGRFARIDLIVYRQDSKVPVEIPATDQQGAINVGRPAIEE